jgi:UDP-N-acetyl-D-mannosaminuronate dehydrogenase
MIAFDALITRQTKVAVVGLGYVGLPLAALTGSRSGVLNSVV